jgi:hypothetical protein
LVLQAANVIVYHHMVYMCDQLHQVYLENNAKNGNKSNYNSNLGNFWSLRGTQQVMKTSGNIKNPKDGN